MRISNRVSLVASGALSVYLTHASDCNAYLVHGEKSCFLIDTGTGLDQETVIRAIEEELTAPLRYILITHHHAAHIGGLAGLQAHFGAKVFVPEAEFASIRDADEEVMGLAVARRSGYYPADYCVAACHPNATVRPGQTLELDGERITVYSAAGHSLGGVCYLFTDGEMLFSGDLVMRGGLINLQNIPGADLAAYAQSVLTLEQAPIRQLYPGHGCFCLKEGKSHIDVAAAQFRSLGVPKNFI